MLVLILDTSYLILFSNAERRTLNSECRNQKVQCTKYKVEIRISIESYILYHGTWYFVQIIVLDTKY